MNLLDKMNILLNAKLNELKTVASSGEPPSIHILEQTLQRLEAERRALAQQLGQKPSLVGTREVNQLEQTLNLLEAQLAQLKREALHSENEPDLEDEPELAARKSRLT